MKKKKKVLKPCMALLLFFTFSMLVIGCGENGESKFQTEKVEGKQLMKENSEHTNVVKVVKVNASDSEELQVFPVDDEIHLEEWIQLVKDIKFTLGKMEEMGQKVLQTSEPR